MLSRLLKDTEHIYIACQPTDFRKQIDGLVALVTMHFKLDPFSKGCAFIFCNKRKNAIKVLRYDENGFILATKKLLEDLKFQWPKTPDDVRKITSQQMEWLLQGLELEPKKRHHIVEMSNKNSCF
ncbi:MAG: IS66 family insertion sequence element accessory protein TnpB [Cellulosilyticaceae bacterium]